MTPQRAASAAITVYWGDILYDTILCPPQSAFTVGTEANDFFLEIETAAGLKRLELLRVNESGTAELLFDDSIEGFVRDGKTVLTLSTLIKEKKALPLENGLYQYPLQGKDTAELMMGHVTFQVGWLTKPVPLPRAPVWSARGIGAWVSFLLFLVPVGYWVEQAHRTSEKKQPERLVTLIPKAARNVAPPPPPPLPTPAPPPPPVAPPPVPVAPPPPTVEKPLAPKVKVPPRPASKARPPAAAVAKETLNSSSLGSLSKGLTSLGAESAPSAPVRNSPARPLSLSGGLSTDGLKEGAAPERVTKAGTGETKFEGTGRARLSTHTLGLSSGGGGGTAEATGLDRETIETAIYRKKARVRACYERQLTSNPELKGRIRVYFEITPTGNTAKPQVLEDTTYSTPLRSCLLAEISTWTFPIPRGGVTVPVDYPFVFEPADRNR